MPFDDPTPSPSAKRSAERDLVDQVCKWIDLHLDEQIDWTRLMRISGLSVAQFQQLFQKLRKTTPMMYLRTRRLERAAQGTRVRQLTT